MHREDDERCGNAGDEGTVGFFENGFSRGDKNRPHEKQGAGEAEFEGQFRVIIFGVEDGGVAVVGFVKIVNAHERAWSSAEDEKSFGEERGLFPDVEFVGEGFSCWFVFEAADEAFAEKESGCDDSDDEEGGGQGVVLALETFSQEPTKGGEADQKCEGASAGGAGDGHGDPKYNDGRKKNERGEAAAFFRAKEFAEDPTAAKHGGDVNPVGEVVAVGEGAGAFAP